MTEAVVESLLKLPILNFSDASKTSEGTDFESVIKARQHYETKVKDFVDEGKTTHFTPEVVEACIDILLRYFNAANFVGDISLVATAADGDENNDHPSGSVCSSSTSSLAKLSADAIKNRELRIQQLSSAATAAKLEALAPRVFKHFHCSDREEMPPSAFTTSSKAGSIIPNREDVAEGASRILPPEPYRLLLRSLVSDGEAMESAVRRASLLATSVALAHTLPVNSIWRLRAFFRHQLALAHRSNSLHTRLMEGITAISNGDIPKSQAPALALEMAHIYAFYHRPEGAHRFLQQAVETSGLVLTEDAFHGIRTRHMQHENPQLILTAVSAVDASLVVSSCSSSNTIVTVNKHWEQPSVIQSESSGHDILDRPRKLGSSEQYDNAKPLLLRDYAIILALCSHLKQSTAEHGLTTHQARIYVERLMVEQDGSVPWAFRAMALLLRARFEYGKNRVQERAFLQYQELIDSVVPEGAARLVRAAFYGEDAESNAANEHFIRLERCDPNSGLFYAVAWPSQWSLRREYGERCFEDNLYKTALELFELTLDWPNIIKCCKELDRRNKAASLAEDLLKEDPTDVMLWVALGEAKRDEAHLLHAWELSKGMMAAPMRSLAKLALSRERYDDVVKYFDQSVRINPIFGGDWFALGFASMRLQQQDRAGEAFTRVCQIDPDDSYAWANLAAILLRQGKRRPAFNATSQALRNNPQDWRMWDNYFRMGVEIREVTESAHALRRVMIGAGQKYQPEYDSLSGFAKIAIQYIRGEIEASANDDFVDGDDDGTEGGLEQQQQQQQQQLQKPKRQEANGENAADDDFTQAKKSKSTTVALESVEGAEKLRVPAFPVGAVEDGEEMENSGNSNCNNKSNRKNTSGVDDDEDDDGNTIDAAAAAANAGLQPLFSEIADVDETFYKDPVQKKLDLDLKIRARFEKRTRELMLEIGGTYTSHSCVHAALADFFGALDGPLTEFVWRSKQVRETLQQPLWERTKEKLLVVIDAVTAMTRCAVEAEKVLKEKPQETKTDDGSFCLTAAAPKRETLQQLNHILEKATPHFENAEVLRPLQVCIVKLKKL